MQRNPWMHHITWLSLAGFVAVPFQGTGAALGVVVGRLLGLSRTAIVIATGCGSLFGSSALALAGDYWGERITAIAQRPLFAFTAVALIASWTILASHFVFHEPNARRVTDKRSLRTGNPKGSKTEPPTRQGQPLDPR